MPGNLTYSEEASVSFPIRPTTEQHVPCTKARQGLSDAASIPLERAMARICRVTHTHTHNGLAFEYGCGSALDGVSRNLVHEPPTSRAMTANLHQPRRIAAQEFGIVEGCSGKLSSSLPLRLTSDLTWVVTDAASFYSLICDI